MQVNWQLFSQKNESFFSSGEVGKWESGKVGKCLMDRKRKRVCVTETRQHYKIINRVLIILINNINNNNLIL